MKKLITLLALALTYSISGFANEATTPAAGSTEQKPAVSAPAENTASSEVKSDKVARKHKGKKAKSEKKG